MDAGKQRVALVTGAGSGIGRATALELHARGWRIAGFDRDEAALDALADELGDGRAIVCAGDVTDAAAVEAAVARVTEVTGGIDLLANVAGIGSTDNVVQTPPEVWMRSST